MEVKVGRSLKNTKGKSFYIRVIAQHPNITLQVVNARLTPEDLIVFVAFSYLKHVVSSTFNDYHYQCNHITRIPLSFYFLPPFLFWLLFSHFFLHSFGGKGTIQIRVGNIGGENDLKTAVIRFHHSFIIRQKSIHFFFFFLG